MTVRVFLGGEGNSELGDRTGSKEYPPAGREGVVVALARRQVPSGWEVCGARRWKDIKKGHGHGLDRPEMQNVAGLAQAAREAAAHVLLFLRDDDADDERAEQIQKAIALVEADFPDLCILGGIPRRSLEAWILALAGETGAEKLGKERLKALLSKRNLAASKSAETYVSIVEEAADPRRADAARLVAWLSAVEAGLGRLVGQAPAPFA